MNASIYKLQLTSSLHSTEQNLDSGLDSGLESGLNRRLRNWTRINGVSKVYVYYESAARVGVHFICWLHNLLPNCTHCSTVKQWLPLNHY